MSELQEKLAKTDMEEAYGIAILLEEQKHLKKLDIILSY
jgi:hypothetical protein